MNRAELASRIDHTNLRPEATEKDILKLCDEATRYRCATVCVNPYWVPVAVSALAGHDVRVCGVVGFPLGANRTPVKAAEAARAVRDGASEVDMVVNIGRLVEGSHALVERDIGEVRRAIGSGVVLKAILETAVLTADQKQDAARLAVSAGADFVKTSTGFHPAGGATAEDVSLLASVVKGRARVKAAGGIRTVEAALEMLQAGADRLGMSSTVAILQRLAEW